MAKYVLHCDACGTNIVTDGEATSGKPEVKLAQIPGSIPKFDAQEKKTVTGKPVPRRRMFKCPKCGRGVIVRGYTVPLPEPVPEGKDKDVKDNAHGCEARPTGRTLPPDFAS